MIYFIKTEKLLFDPLFLKFAKGAYTSYIVSDELESQFHWQEGGTFDVTIDSWMYLCDHAKRTKDLLTFKEFAIERAKKLALNDWEGFDDRLKGADKKTHKNTIAEFLQEADEVRDKIAQKDYLGPLLPGLNEVLDRIVSHYSNTSITTNKSKSMNGQPERSKLKWRGGASALCALFLDLRNEKMKKTEDKYLSVGDTSLVEFIMNNFEFLNSDNEIEAISKDSIKRYVDGKEVSQRIKLDFTGLKK